MLHSIKRKLKSEKGSAVVGFAVGAPFVLFVFIGFIDVTHMAWKTTVSQFREKGRLQEFALSTELQTPPGLYVQQIDEIGITHSKGSNWNLWRIKE